MRRDPDATNGRASEGSRPPRERNRRGGLARTAAVVTVAVLLGAGVGRSAPEIEPAPAPPELPRPAADGWVPLGAGLELVRGRDLPALIWYVGSPVRPAGGVPGDGVPGGGVPGDGAPGDGVPGEGQPADVQPGGAASASADFATLLAHRSLRSTLARFVLIGITDADLDTEYPAPPAGPRPPPGPERAAARPEKPAAPEPAPAPAPAPAPGPAPAPAPAPGPARAPAPGAVSVRERLRLPPGAPALLMLDFRERLVGRSDGALPERRRLLARLRKVAETSAMFAKHAPAVERALLESRHAVAVGNTRLAVLRVRDLEPPQARTRIDPVLGGWVVAAIEDYRGRATKLLDEAAALEKEGDLLRADSGVKYGKAIDAYDKVARDFPFADVVRRSSQRQGDILRKMALTGQNPFGR